MHGHAGHVVPTDFDLARVESGSHPMLSGPSASRMANAHAMARPGLSNVATIRRHRLDLMASEPPESAANGMIMSIEEITPPVISELASQLGGADDVSEQDRGEHSFRSRASPPARHKLLARRATVRCHRPSRGVLTRKFDQPRVRRRVCHSTTGSGPLNETPIRWTTRVGALIVGRRCRTSVPRVLAESPEPLQESLRGFPLGPTMLERRDHPQPRARIWQVVVAELHGIRIRCQIDAGATRSSATPKGKSGAQASVPRRRTGPAH